MSGSGARQSARRSGMDGVLVIDKPPGMTSHAVVGAVRRGIGAGRRHGPRVGHAGTLDPDATGVLVVALGRATKLVPYLQASRKTYAGRIRLGATTTTLDASGDVVEVRDTSGVDEQRVDEALRAFVGEIQQIPPMVSAVKVGGERLHRKARRGEVVERAPRTVTIHDIALESFDPGPPPEAAVTVTCTAGTYIRTLAADVGERVGCGGHLAVLRRLASGRFTVDEARSLADVERLCADGELEGALLPMADAVADYPAVVLDPGSAAALRHGRPLAPTGEEGPVAALAPDGALIAMVEDRRGAAKPLVVVAPAGGVDG